METYCTNCGAKNGETHAQLMRRQRILGDARNASFTVRSHERGVLCQFCAQQPNTVKRYNSQTGEYI